MKRDKLGRFVKGNHEGRPIDKSNAAAYQAAGERSKKKAKTEAEIYEMISRLPIPDNFDGVHKTLDKFGVEPSERNIMAAIAINMARIAMSDDKKAAIAAAHQVHKAVSDGKLDITTNGKDIKAEPMVIEVIDSREQVVNREDVEEDE